MDPGEPEEDEEGGEKGRGCCEGSAGYGERERKGEGQRESERRTPSRIHYTRVR